MNLAYLWMSGFTFVAVSFLVIGLAAWGRLIKHPVDRRVERIAVPRPVIMNALVYSMEDQTVVGTLGQRVAPKDPAKRTMSRQRLAMAGFYSEAALYNYWGAKIVCVMLPPTLILLIGIALQIDMKYALLPLLFITGASLFLPDVYLYFRKRYRQEQIFRGLPDALDLLLVCVEAGLGLDAAMQKVSDEIVLGCRVLSEEMKLSCTAVRFGQPRNEALRELGERTGVKDLRSLSAVLIQADRFGTGIGQALRVHAEDMRTRRRQRAEELAAKTTVKLIFPLVLFIFPAIFVVLGGPAIIKIFEQFVKH